MHLPDGFLDPKTTLLSAGVAAAGLGIALRQVRSTLEPRQMPLLGLSAAFVFVAQMINFPVVGGTSGHLIGGVLTAVLLGPSAAVVVMSCVLMVQCLVFADGGLTALGANMFNMAVVNVAGGYGAFRLARGLMGGNRPHSVAFAAAFAGWCGTVLASIACSGQLALSGTVPWALGFPAMANVHMLIGIGEGLATGLVLAAIWRVRPEAMGASHPQGEPGPLALVGYGLLLAAGLAVFVAPFACPWPDGLESVARSLGFEARASFSPVPAPLADYRLGSLGSAAAATAAAGLIGTVIVFLAAFVLARGVVSRKKDAPSEN